MARKIEIEVTGDTRSLERALSGAQKKSKSSFDGIARAAGIAGAAIATGLAVVAKVGFDELAESQKVMAQTEAVLKSTGGQAGVTAKDVDTLAQSLSNLSGVDDETIAAGENLLLTFTNIHNEVGKGNDIFDQATEATLDMSVALGTDMKDAAIITGKALNDPVRGLTALRRVGVQFTDKQEKLIKKLVETGDVAGAQKIILRELKKEFGGSAKAAGETLPGQLNKAKNAFSDVSGELVAGLLPVITDVLEYVTRFTEWAKENPDIMKKVAVGLGILAGALLAASVAQTILNLAVLANPYVAAVAAVSVFYGALYLLYKRFEFVRDHWQLLLIAFGIGPVVVATVVKAIIRHWGTISPVLDAIRDKAVAAFNAIKAVVVPVFNTIKTHIVNQINAAKDVFNTLKDVAVRAFNAIKGPVNTVKDAVNALIGAVQSLIGWLGNIRLPSFPSDPTPGFDVPGVPYFQHGGVMPGPRGKHSLAMVAGGETILPTHRRGGGGVTIVIQNHGLISSPDQVVNLLRNAVARWERTNGKAAF